jgi:N6-L-threonylcarbamoyladenine synthase
MKPAWRSTTASAACWRTRCTARSDVHAEYGGVVPELASRDHVRKTLPLVGRSCRPQAVTGSAVDGVAYTAGRGSPARCWWARHAGAALAWGWNVPAIGVHHMEGHLLAPMLEARPPQFPFVALLVSGGHTQLVRVDGIGQYRLSGRIAGRCRRRGVRQDRENAGACPIPAGRRCAPGRARGCAALRFSPPDGQSPGPGFQFQRPEDLYPEYDRPVPRGGADLSEQDRCDIARAFEDAVVATLAIKCRRALQAGSVENGW